MQIVQECPHVKAGVCEPLTFSRLYMTILVTCCSLEPFPMASVSTCMLTILDFLITPHCPLFMGTFADLDVAY